jgi:hypothetical protein
MNGFIRGKEIHFDEEYLHVKLDDNRIISTPLSWYKPLENATLSQLKSYRFICDNSGIEWEEIDYHLSIESMLKIDVSNVA